MSKKHRIGWGPVGVGRMARAEEMWRRELAKQRAREARRAVVPAAQRAGTIRLFFYELLTQLIVLLAFFRTRLIEHHAVVGGKSQRA